MQKEQNRSKPRDDGAPDARTPNPTTLDQTMSALADPTRRAILDRLAGGALRVTEIAAPLPMSLNAVSKHIKILERARLVQRRRVGREHFLSVDPAALDDAADWIGRRRALWAGRLDRLEQLLAEDEASAGEATAEEAFNDSDKGENR